MTAMTAAHRTTGVAPLSVFFNAVGGGSGIAQPGGGFSTRDFDYLWEFGDPSSGDWAHMDAATNGSVVNSKNFEIGCLACHVYETPGIYTARCHVIDDDGTEFDYEEEITVTDPETVYAGWTRYASEAGNDGNDGSIGSPWRTFAFAFSQMIAGAGPRRILLNRGDDFTATDHDFGTVTGPYHIGAYGSGAKPIVTGDNDCEIIATNATDVRVVDIDFRLPAPIAFGTAFSSALKGGTNTLQLRCDVLNFTFGFDPARSYGTNQECTYEQGESGQVWVSEDAEIAIGWAMLGCTFRNARAGTHSFRSEQSLSLIAHNKIEGGTITDGKIYGGNSTEETPTNHVNVVGNVFIGHSMTGWVFEFGPQSPAHTEWVEDILVEGNLFAPAGSGALSTLWVGSASRTTFRNNVIWLISPTGAGTISPRNPSAGEDPGGCIVEHISIYQQSSPDSTAYGMQFDTTDSTIYRNNVVYAPGKTIEAPSGTVTVTNTLADNTDPDWTLENSGDFTLEVTSPCIDAGSTATRTRRDFRRALRDQDEPDQGAFEFGATPPTETPTEQPAINAIDLFEVLGAIV